jgi:DNA topoisomerase VI subunit B
MGGLGPQYEAALNNARAIDNTGLARELETRIINSRGPDQAALRQVRAMLDIPTNPGNLDPHPRALQAAREAVRGMMQAEENPSVRGQLEHVYRRMTQELQAKVPGIRQIDSQYAELGAQERAAQTGSQGSRIFQTDRENVVRPAEAERIMTETAQPKGSNVGPSAEPFRFREATRNELDRIVGTNRHDLAALERILGQPQDWNSQKLATVFGADRAAALRAVLERERTFANTFQDVVKGPQTADRLLAAKALDAGEGKIPLETTMFGAASRGLQAAGQALRSSASASNRDRIAALMATQDPAELQRLVQQILATNPGRDTTQRATREAIARMMSGAPALAPSMTNR